MQFQFHIVRLKVFRGNIQDRGKRVSIPYSSIKSHSVRLPVLVSAVSIPYSSIKRIDRAWKISCFNVSIPYSSIKRDTTEYVTCRSLVSIPYSSIKSQTRGKRDISNRVFQFHIVRLKAVPTNEPYETNAFQFHIVRLKVLFRSAYLFFFFTFQFHIVRLKVSGFIVHRKSYGVSIPYSSIKSC